MDKLGPLSSCTSALVTLTNYAMAPVKSDTQVRAFLKSSAITAANGLHSLAQLVEKIVNFIVAKVKALVGSEQFQDIKNNKAPYVIEKATEFKDYIVGKATAAYSRISSFQLPAALKRS